MFKSCQFSSVSNVCMLAEKGSKTNSYKISQGAGGSTYWGVVLCAPLCVFCINCSNLIDVREKLSNIPRDLPLLCAYEAGTVITQIQGELFNYVSSTAVEVCHVKDISLLEFLHAGTVSP